MAKTPELPLREELVAMVRAAGLDPDDVLSCNLSCSPDAMVVLRVDMLVTETMAAALTGHGPGVPVDVAED
jgi:ABC-type nitrate/sulfonate/bicarbonate transport system substrate-binding protein